MSISGDILRAYRGFGASMRHQLDSGVKEERILAYGVFAILITFIARTPGLIEASKTAAAATADDVTWVAIFSTNLVVSFFFGLLLLYGIAGLSHVLAKIFGGKGSFFGARLALFWSLLVISPLALVSTMLKTLLPFEWLGLALDAALGLLFLFAWISCLVVAEKTK